MIGECRARRMAKRADLAARSPHKNATRVVGRGTDLRQRPEGPRTRHAPGVALGKPNRPRAVLHRANTSRLRSDGRQHCELGILA
jgi:hypothetical protein